MSDMADRTCFDSVLDQVFDLDRQVIPTFLSGFLAVVFLTHNQPYPRPLTEVKKAMWSVESPPPPTTSPPPFLSRSIPDRACPDKILQQ